MSKPQRYLSLDRVVSRSVAENLKTGVVLDVARGPAIRGAVGGERSALSAEEATPALRRRSPTTPASFAAKLKPRHDSRVVGRMLAESDASAATPTNCRANCRS